jgi:hypothetical protein
MKNETQEKPTLKLRDFTPKGWMNYSERTWNATENSDVVKYNLGLMAINYSYAISAGLAMAGLEQLLK